MKEVFVVVYCGLICEVLHAAVLFVFFPPLDSPAHLNIAGLVPSAFVPTRVRDESVRG